MNRIIPPGDGAPVGATDGERDYSNDRAVDSSQPASGPDVTSSQGTSLKTMTVAEAELRVALDQIARLLDIIRCSDPEWVAAHGPDVQVVYDEEWDEVVGEAEDYLDEMRDRSRR